MSNIGSIIRARRKEVNMSLATLASHVGVNKGTVSKWENGTIKNISIERMYLLSKILSVNLDDFFVAEEPPVNCLSFDFLTNSENVPILNNKGMLALHSSADFSGFSQVQKNSLSADKEYFFVEVEDEQMSPYFLPKDLVLVCPDEKVENNEYALVVVDGGVGIVKKVVFSKDAITLVSENPYFPAMKFDNSEKSRVKIYGKIVECHRKF